MDKYVKYYETAVKQIAEGTEPGAFVALFYEFFSIPIIIVDEAFKLIAYANDGSFADPYWEDIVQFGTARTETITTHYLKAGYLESISTSSEAIFVDWGVAADFPQTCGPVYVNKELEGFISLLFLDLSQTEEIRRLNTMICQLFGLLLQTSDYKKKTMRNPIRQVFARRFFDPDSVHEYLDEGSYRPFVDISPEYEIIAIGTLPESDSMREVVRRRIRSLYPSVIYQFRKEKLLVLIQNRTADAEKTLLKRMKKVLTEYKMCAGISQRFDRIEDRGKYIEQAETALTAGLALHPEEVVFPYGEYYPGILFMAARSALSEENLIPEELKRLMEFDRVHGTDYCGTLKGYLYERNDLNRASAHLHIHRNTLRYRMEKIRQIMGEDPDDAATALRLTVGFGVSE